MGGTQLENNATSWSNLQDCKISSIAEIPKLDRVWQYWFMSVSVRYKSVNVPPPILQDVSRKARLNDVGHPQSGVSVSLGVVCVMVNLIVGWILLLLLLLPEKYHQEIF